MAIFIILQSSFSAVLKEDTRFQKRLFDIKSTVLVLKSLCYYYLLMVVLKIYLQFESTVVKKADTFPYLKISTEADISSDFSFFPFLAISEKLLFTRS